MNAKILNLNYFLPFSSYNDWLACWTKVFSLCRSFEGENAWRGVPGWCGDILNRLVRRVGLIDLIGEQANMSSKVGDFAATTMLGFICGDGVPG